MCYIIWERCPLCECASKEPTCYKSAECPAEGCPTPVELKVTSPRSRWSVFRCETEDCGFSNECCEKLERQYRSFGKVVKSFGSALGLALPTATSPNLAAQQHYFPAPVAVHPAYLASIAEAAEAAETPSTSGNSQQVPAPAPRWAKERMARPDLRRARKERKRISFGQPSQGNRVKVQFRSMGPVRMSDLEPEFATAIMAKKESMDQKIEEQSASPKAKVGGAARYLLEEDELLQMLRLNDFSFRQIHTDFMPRRESGALIRRRDQHSDRHAKGFVYIPDDANFEEPTSTVGETRESSAVAENEMVVGSASTIADTSEENPAGDEREVDKPEHIEQSTPAQSSPFKDVQMDEEVKQAATPGNPADVVDAKMNEEVEQLTLAVKHPKVEVEESQPTTETETQPAQQSQVAKTSVIVV